MNLAPCRYLNRSRDVCCACHKTTDNRARNYPTHHEASQQQKNCGTMMPSFHLRRERWVGLREFLEGEARSLRDDLINAQLGSTQGFARGVLLGFVKSVADGKFGGNSTPTDLYHSSQR